jgi:hypothetical protein
VKLAVGSLLPEVFDVGSLSVGSLVVVDELEMKPV